MKENLVAFNRLVEIMSELREKCPWDKKQTMDSLRHLTIEEVYELSESILNQNMEEVKKELGDLILHIVFYSLIASEKNHFDLTDVLNSISDKLIYRHPHIYGETKVKDENEVKENWEKLKLKEGKDSVLEGVPDSLPSIIKAFRLQEKAKGVGFDWNKHNQAWNKVKEEIIELEHEIIQKDNEKIELEFGDVLFSLINYARLLDINPDDALEKVNKKFITRFKKMEDFIKIDGKDFNQMTLEQMDVYWENAKKDLSI